MNDQAVVIGLRVTKIKQKREYEIRRNISKESLREIDRGNGRLKWLKNTV